MALVGTLVGQRSASVSAEATRMLWNITNMHGICPELHYPVPEFATLAKGDCVHCVPRALAALGVGLCNPITCPRAAHVQLQYRQGATPQHVPPDGAPNDALAWAPRAAPPLPRQRRAMASGGAGLPQPVRRRAPPLLREQGPTDHPRWRDALVHLFHTTGMRDSGLRLMHPTRAKQDAHTGPQVTLDGLHHHVGGYRRQGSLSPPTQRAAYHAAAALLYILRDVLADGQPQAPNADVAWPEPLRPRPDARTPVWLVITDDQCARATEQAQLRTEWVIVQVGEGEPWPCGLPRGTTLLVTTAVLHNPHMAVHPLEDHAEDAGHLVVHQRGGPAWLSKHITAL